MTIEQIKQSINEQALIERERYVARYNELQAELTRASEEHDATLGQLHAALVALGGAEPAPPAAPKTGELSDAIVEMAKDRDTFTVKQAAAATGGNQHTVRHAIRRLVSAGTLTEAGKQANGSARPAVLYRMATTTERRKPFTERRNLILEYVVSNPNATGLKIAQETGLSQGSVARDIKKLVDAGVLTYGSGSNGSRPVSLVS